MRCAPWAGLSQYWDERGDEKCMLACEKRLMIGYGFSFSRGVLSSRAFFFSIHFFRHGEFPLLQGLLERSSSHETSFSCVLKTTSCLHGVTRDDMSRVTLVEHYDYNSRHGTSRNILRLRMLNCCIVATSKSFKL